MPKIVNTDQGSQFTATEFTDVVLAQGCQLSMDGRGAWRDNVFVERLWRSVKYERVYLKTYASVSAARADIADYTGWYNAGRVHSSMDEITPDEHYFANLKAVQTSGATSHTGSFKLQRFANAQPGVRIVDAHDSLESLVSTGFADSW